MKVKSSNFIGFDIGSSKITALAASINKQGEAIVNNQILQHSEGFRYGNIINMENAENCVINAIYALEKESDKSIQGVSVSLSGSGVKSYYVSNKTKISNAPISKQDVKKLINKALAKFQIKDYEIIHYFPMNFNLDNRQIVEDPVGMYAREFSCQVHIIAADSIMLMNLAKCLAKCNVEVTEVIASIYASGMSTLSADEKQLGSIIVDIGSHTTSYAVFLEGKIVYVSHIPIGGMHITTEIAKNLSISIKEAEKLKIIYGNASASQLIKDSVINLESQDRSITTTQLAGIINPIVNDIFIKIRRHIASLKMEKILTRTMAITGGTAAMPGIKNVAAEIFQKRVRIAKPESPAGFADSYNSYIHSTLIGMLKINSLKYLEKSYISSSLENESWMRRFIHWLKENI